MPVPKIIRDQLHAVGPCAALSRYNACKRLKLAVKRPEGGIPMATQDLVQMLIGSVLENPQLITSLMDHPYSTVSQATGTPKEDLSRDEVGEVITAFSTLAGGGSVDFNTLPSASANMLGQSNGSAHTLAQTLLGGLLGGGAAPAQPEPIQPVVTQPVAVEAAPAASAGSGIPTELLLNLAGAVFNSNNTATGKGGFDLSDGFGLEDILALANMFLRNR